MWESVLSSAVWVLGLNSGCQAYLSLLRHLLATWLKHFVCTCDCMETRVQFLMSSSGTLSASFETVSYWLAACQLSYTGWAVSLKDPSFFSPTCYTTLYMSLGGVVVANSGPHVCKANIYQLSHLPRPSCIPLWYPSKLVVLYINVTLQLRA